MAKGYEKQNDKVIKNAFEKFLKDKERILKQGMYRLLEDAVQTALGLHDASHQSHIIMGDTYGWMLVVNGKIDKIQVQAKGGESGNATAMLRTYVDKVPSTGIVGVVMAGMQPANYFAVTYEKGLLENTIQLTRQNFFQYFKQI